MTVEVEIQMPSDGVEAYVPGCLDSRVGTDITLSGHPDGEVVGRVLGARYGGGDAWLRLEVPDGEFAEAFTVGPS